MKRLLALPLAFALGCASATYSPGADLAGSGGRDGSGSDLAGRDLATSGGGDQAMPSDLSMGGGDLSGPDLSGPADLAVPGAPYGTNCAQDTDCQSMLCKDVVKGGPSKVCVASCTSQTDCANLLNAFCEPITAGSPMGYCVPRSPMHCASCRQDSDCGSLAERCIQAPGDIAPACHIDCALAGAAACPSDYSCTAVPDGAMNRMLCTPTFGTCLDSLGGWCDRVGLPQPCARVNSAGTCVGERNCLMPAERYDKCGATSPQFLMTCADMNPAGCTEMYAPGAISTPQNCGACGNVCPGTGLANDDTQCLNPATKQCGLTCRGENYDVNGNPADGCEVLDADAAGHNTGAAGNLGAKDCSSGTFQTFNGHIDSDARVHANPAVTAFNGTVGSAPDYWVVDATGGLFCENDYGGTFTTSGGGATPCYQLQVMTDKMKNITITNTGSQSQGFSSPDSCCDYSDNTNIYFVVTKTCSLPVQESVSYSINYHL
jgi:hypothetical protein